MLKTWKKAVSLVLVFAMSMMVCVPAFAASSNDTESKTVTESQIQSEISKEEKKIFSNVYDQLKAQNATDLMDTYKEILIPKVEAQVRASHQSTLEAKRSDDYTINFYFPNGGYVIHSGSLDAHVVDTCLNPDDTKQYMIDQTYSIGNIIETLATFVPGTRLIGLAADLQVILNYSEKKDVEASNYYSEIIEVDDGLAESGCVVIGWDNHPYCSISSDETILDYEAF